MKHLKKITLLLLATIFMLSCEEETIISPESAEIQTQLNDGEPSEKLQLYLGRLAAQKNKKGTAARIIDESNYKAELCGEITEGAFENYIPFYWYEEELYEVYEPHLYTFNGTEGDEISIYIPRKTANFDPAFTIFDDSFETISDPWTGALIYADDEVASEYGGCFADPMIENFVLPYTGSYTLVVIMLSACEFEEEQIDFPEGDIYPYEIHVTGIDSCDYDDDGVLNEDDPFPNSNMDEMLSIGRTNFDIENKFSDEGTTMMDEVDALIERLNEQYDNGSNSSALSIEFKREMAKISYYWYKSRLISRRDRVAISRAVANVSFPFYNQEPG